MLNERMHFKVGRGELIVGIVAVGLSVGGAVALTSIEGGDTATHFPSQQSGQSGSQTIAVPKLNPALRR